MKKRLAAFFMLMLIFASAMTGCSSVLTQADEREQTLLRLSIQKGIPQEASDGLDVFIAQVEKISERRVKIEKSVTDDPLSAIEKGSDIIFASNSEITRGNGDFLSFVSPFYFSGYTHMTVTLNSSEFKELISDRTESLIGAAPLAAFYGGSKIFVSNESDMLDMWDEWQDIKVTISADSDLLEVALEGLGAVVDTSNSDELMTKFLNAKLRTIECEPEALNELTDNKVKDAFIYVYNSFHAPVIHWMMVNSDTWESLDDYTKAVITDAAAKALAVNDEAVLKKENACFDHADALDIPIYEMDYEDFTEKTDAVFKEKVRYRNLWDWFLHSSIRSLTSEQKALLTVYS